MLFSRHAFLVLPVLLACGGRTPLPDESPSAAPESTSPPAGVPDAAVIAGKDSGAAPSAPAGSPVARWGQLSICGTQICNQKGQIVQLKGVSSMWLNWENNGYAENLEALRWMRDNWNLTVIRAAMGVEPSGAYLSNPDTAKKQVTTIIDNAIAAGVYVIVDWHEENAYKHTDKAVAFFSEMAGRYGDKPNLLWETFNEPLQVSWSNVLKPYHQTVVDAIRAKDPDNLIILGTPQWSQKVDEAAADPLPGTNLMYTLHFYSCTHTAWLRQIADQAWAKIPLFVTEWGATDADGGLNGRVCLDEADLWSEWMRWSKVSWTAWKLDNCTPDSTCLLSTDAPVSGGWTDQFLHGHGKFVRDRMIETGPGIP